MLADATHLRAVILVGREAVHFVSDGRAQTPTSRGLTESGAHGLRVGETPGAHDLEGRGGSVVKTDVQRASHLTEL